MKYGHLQEENNVKQYENTFTNTVLSGASYVYGQYRHFVTVFKLIHYMQFVLYCVNRVVIAAQCTATFPRSIVLPRI